MLAVLHLKLFRLLTRLLSCRKAAAPLHPRVASFTHPRLQHRKITANYYSCQLSRQLLQVSSVSPKFPLVG